tara:strand:- start:323 stop:964 length:642 start_codon:yes stop_codon:yes gene_type:complete
MKTISYDSLIFDLDGTLWDTTEAIVVAWNNVLERNKINFKKIDSSDIKKVTGMQHDECVKTIFRSLDKKKQSFIIKETMIEDNLIIKKNGGRLYSGVIEGLRLLNQHYKMYIVSNCQKGYIEIFLNLYKLNDIFLDFECWGNTKKSKSDNIDMVKNRNQLQNPLYIGDTNGDMTAANKANVKFYQLTYGFGDKIDEAISFPTFTDLVKNLIPN